MKYSQASEMVNQLVAKLVEEHQTHYGANSEYGLNYAIGYIGSMLAYAMVEDKDLAKQVKSALENRK
jgi:hypothetical protein